ncbi:hypothetical protein B7P43_G01475 [Cryptotermes secundus]|uniref:tRNA-splicing endonuclease subunit Sen15 domain-containing protein n=1 Tax=Cryptotermes secundus TaxID=105785 RepID=A0A2J7RK47_9NEOP|nr:hypothetical protein B7P43_G01475 [Cryptotermes secundus]
MYLVQALHDVKYLYNRELDLLYLMGKDGRGSQSASRTEIFLPLSTVCEITPAWIQKVQDTLCADQEEKGITLAMKEHDSTVVYYRLTQGLLPPDSPETKHRKKQLDEQKRFIEGEICRMRHKLTERAHNAGSLGEAKTFIGNEQETAHSASTTAVDGEHRMSTREDTGHQPHTSTGVTEESTQVAKEYPDDSSSGRTLAVQQQD